LWLDAPGLALAYSTSERTAAIERSSYLASRRQMENTLGHMMKRRKSSMNISQTSWEQPNQGNFFQLGGHAASTPHKPPLVGCSLFRGRNQEGSRCPASRKGAWVGRLHGGLLLELLGYHQGRGGGDISLPFQFECRPSNQVEWSTAHTPA
jgi:hypothetical protein